MWRRARFAAIATAVACASSAGAAHAEQPESLGRLALGGALHMAPVGFLGKVESESQYREPSGFFAFGAEGIARYRVIPLLRFGFVPAYTRTIDPGHPQAVDTLTLPFEVGVRIFRIGPNRLWFLARVGYARAWHHGQTAASPDGSAIVAKGSTMQAGLGYGNQLGRHVASYFGAFARLDTQYIPDGTLLYGGIFFEAGVTWNP